MIPLLVFPLHRVGVLGPVPNDITVHVDAGYDSVEARTLISERGLRACIARNGRAGATQASQR
jgi:hypothetical protein